MADTIKGALPSLSLTGLTTWLAAKECLFGPVIKIGNNGQGTAATFKTGAPIPTTSPVIKLAQPGQANVIPAGATKLAEGKVFISDAIQNVVVYRPA